MSTEILYVSSNTDLQAIDTFDPPTVSSLDYVVEISSNTDQSVCQLQVGHDGATIAEIQTGISVYGIPPEITTDFLDTANGYVGRILVQPPSAVTTFKLIRIENVTNVYSENTQSGKLIQSNTGFGVNFQYANNVTVRQTDNNYQGNLSKYTSNYVLGPIGTVPELITSLQSSNGSVISYSGNTVTITSSGQFDNYQYQDLTVEPGRLYVVSGNAYYVDADAGDAKDPQVSSTGAPQVRVIEGTDVLVAFQVNTTPTAFSQVFIPSTGTIRVAAGLGSWHRDLVITNFSCKEAVPFHTYDQWQGSFFTKWTAVDAGNTLFTLYSTDGTVKILSIDNTNNVIITTNAGIVNCGMQSATNKIAFSYTNTEVIASLNGGAVVANLNSDSVTRVANLVFTSLPSEFSYTPELLSNTTLVEITT